MNLNKLNQLVRGSISSTSDSISTQKTEVESKGNSAPPVLRSKKSDIKTELIKEKIIRYFIDPNTQIDDILQSVDHYYAREECPEELRKTYESAKDFVESGICEPAWFNFIDPENGPFFRIVAALLLIQTARARNIKKDFSDSTLYKFHPAIIGLIGKCANALISLQFMAFKSNPKNLGEFYENIMPQYIQLLEQNGREFFKKFFRAYLDNPQQEKTEFHKIKNQYFEDVLSKMEINSSLGYEENLGQTFYESKYFNEFFYPIILSDDTGHDLKLGLYPPEAFVYAYSQKCALLPLTKAERGVHGGVYKDPLEIYEHDLFHNRRTLDKHYEKENRERAFLAQRFGQNLYEVIKDINVPPEEKLPYWLAAYLVLHESDLVGNGLPPIVDKSKKSPRAIFDCLFEYYLSGARYSLIDKTIGRFINLSNSSDYLKEKFSMAKFLDRKYIRDSRSTILLTMKLAYDVIDGILMTKKRDEKKEWEKNIFPEMEEKKSELKIKYAIHAETEIENYPKGYLHELYVYKTENYDPFEAFKAVQIFMNEFKEKIHASLSDEPIDISKEKDLLELAKEVTTMHTIPHA